MNLVNYAEVRQITKSSNEQNYLKQSFTSMITYKYAINLVFQQNVLDYYKSNFEDLFSDYNENEIKAVQNKFAKSLATFNSFPKSLMTYEYSLNIDNEGEISIEWEIKNAILGLTFSDQKLYCAYSIDNKKDNFSFRPDDINRIAEINNILDSMFNENEK